MNNLLPEYRDNAAFQGYIEDVWNYYGSSKGNHIHINEVVGGWERSENAFEYLSGGGLLGSVERTEQPQMRNEVQTKFDSKNRDREVHSINELIAPIRARLLAMIPDLMVTWYGKATSIEEIEQMQRACKITEDGFRRILKFVKPGVMEYEIQAEYMHEFLRQRSRGFAYEPIVASGFSACVLHYISNNQECKDGDVLLMDVGCEYGNYASDMTRAIPVNGKFTPRQKEVYNAVLHVMKEAQKLLKPGVFLADYHKKVGLLMEEQLIGLGLISKEDVENQDPAMPAYKKYFMHGTSHHLGLDVHDVGNVYRKMEAGMVFTVEPGIYIRDENLGIRLENDVVITEEGLNDLMVNIPIEAEEIDESRVSASASEGESRG